MGQWAEALVFGLALLAFVVGFSSIIMGFLPTRSNGVEDIKNKIEYGFFGLGGLVMCGLVAYLL